MTNPTNKSDEATRFLERDFNQCFEQMRHYDSQLWNIFKFCFTAYSTILPVSFGLYKHTIEKDNSLFFAVAAILIVGFIFGLILIALAIRNRVYFVLATRYINEHRDFFLSEKPLGFPNKTEMYTDSTKPPYFNWRSSQSWFIYTIASFNSTIASFFLYILIDYKNIHWLLLAVFILLFALQICLGIKYLLSRENKSASHAVFGEK